jgi:hypothetical protein
MFKVSVMSPAVGSRADTQVEIREDVSKFNVVRQGRPEAQYVIQPGTSTAKPVPDSPWGEIAELRHQFRLVTDALEAEREARSVAENAASDLLEKLAESMTKIRLLEAAYIPLKADYRALKEDKVSLVKELDEVTELCASKDKLLALQKPLAKIGVDIRKRFLQRAAQNACTWASEFSDSGYPANVHVLDAGNRAAHDGNIEADMALFKGRYLTLKQDADRFETVYHHRHDLERFPFGYRTTIEKWNIMATLRASSNRRLICNPEDKFGVIELLNRIRDLWREIQKVGRRDLDLARYTSAAGEISDQDPTKFEENPDVAEKVDELKGLVEMVVKKVWRKAGVQVYYSKEKWSFLNASRRYIG